jgi:2-polyprenyl-3-methyl-5-hydroxy-6-metoxy-1,4-benzoquinol methylase
MQTVEALGETIREYENGLRPDHEPDGQHMAIPLRMSYFLGGMCVADSAIEGRQFLDVGCGVGNKLRVAHHLGWEVWGIDNWQPYIEVARREVPYAKVKLADAFEFDEYDRFDCVYLYKPCTDNDEEERLEELIVKGMRPGAIAFFVGLDEVPNADSIGGNVWRVRG